MKKLESPLHIIQFLDATYKFIDKHATTSWLMVDKDNTIEDLEDVFNDKCNEPAGIIAEMQNVAAETIWKLEKYYTDTNNKRALARLNKLVQKYKHS